MYLDGDNIVSENIWTSQNFKARFVTYDHITAI